MILGKIIKEFKFNKGKVIFRYPKIEDVSGLLELINSLVGERAYISVQKKMTFKKELYWLVEKIKRMEKKRNIILVLEKDDYIKGLAEIEKFSLKTIPASHIGELEIILAKDVRGKGLGEKFLSAIISEAKKNLKIKIVFIDIAKKNKVALDFYQKMDFKIVGKIKKGFKYYGKYVDDIILVKYL